MNQNAPAALCAVGFADSSRMGQLAKAREQRVKQTRRVEIVVGQCFKTVLLSRLMMVMVKRELR